VPVNADTEHLGGFDDRADFVGCWMARSEGLAPSSISCLRNLQRSGEGHDQQRRRPYVHHSLLQMRHLGRSQAILCWGDPPRHFFLRFDLTLLKNPRAHVRSTPKQMQARAHLHARDVHDVHPGWDGAVRRPSTPAGPITIIRASFRFMPWAPNQARVDSDYHRRPWPRHAPPQCGRP